MHLWVEVARTVVYVQNHTTDQVIENNTSEEDFSREKPEISHIRIFDFPLCIHMAKEKRTKLDPSSRKGIFVGYNDTSKSYRIYFSGFKKIDINRYVTFDEESTYFRSRRKSIQEVMEPSETRV